MVVEEFADINGNIYSIEGSQTKVVAARDIMSADWIYTVFDSWWRGSDDLENALSVVEGIGSTIFRNIERSGVANAQEWDELIWFVSLTACRHPATMGRGYELSKELAIFLNEIHNHSNAASFSTACTTRFGPNNWDELYEEISNLSQEKIEQSAEQIVNLAPYDPSLPQTDALAACNQVTEIVKQMDLRLISAHNGITFVFGDHPLPSRNLAHGFTIPLSKGLALEAKPAAGVTGTKSFSMATPQEVADVNENQAKMADKLVIGPDKSTLLSLGPVPRP